MTQIAASIDLGSHTARLLIARRSGASSGGWIPLVRRRAYIRLAADAETGGEREIGPDVAARALEIMHDFSRLIRELDIGRVHAVATGIIRDAVNRDRFLDHIYEETGIRIRLISGEKEAILSGRGALAALNIKQGPFLVFDLGGGTTEFLQDGGGEPRGTSISLGAAVLTRKFITSDPPGETELDSISKEIDRCLKYASVDLAGARVVIGTGGSVTTLAAMVHGISADDITPERLNGLTLTLSQLEACLAQMKILRTAQRVERLGLDPGRADVIVAGSLVIIGIMRFLGVFELVVSMSDLLEGLLIDD
ncbi:MAG: hypothetical protein ABIL06_05875 [Pseudomonadota bacterium]